jgi:hypothetical protein
MSVTACLRCGLGGDNFHAKIMQGIFCLMRANREATALKPAIGIIGIGERIFSRRENI